MRQQEGAFSFSIVALFTFSGVFSFWGPWALAQLPTATILGVVRDSSGASIPEATVRATHQDTGVSRTTTSGGNGAYRLPALPVGTYRVQAERTGFQTTVQSGLQVTVGQEAVLNFLLEVGAVTESVTVTAEAPIVNTTSGALSSLVDEKTVQELPLNGRNYNDLTLLLPGVNQNKTGGGTTVVGTQFSTNGAPVRSNLFTIDGTIMNDTDGNGSASVNGNTLGVEGIREYRLITNSFSAEYGMTMGSQVTLVTKGGTNQFHGSLFEYFRNVKLKARERSDPTTKPPFTRNNFGGSVGGPIRPDKDFFFATYEGLRDRRSVSFQAVLPTEAARLGDLNGDGAPEVTVAPAVKLYLPYWPFPTEPGSASQRAQGLGTRPMVNNQPRSEDYWQGRIDHTLTGNDSLFGRYTITDASREGSDLNVRPDFVLTRYTTRNQYFTLSDNHIFSPTFLGTFRGSVSRTHLIAANQIDFPRELAFVPSQPMGSLSPGGVSNLVNAGPVTPSEKNQLIEGFSGDLFYTRGNHALKFGTLLNHYHVFVNNMSATDPRGIWNFADFRSFLQGVATSFGAATVGSDTALTYNYNTLGFYIQDDVRVTPTVMLNLGLRYEFTTQPTEIRGKGYAVRDIRNDAQSTPGIPWENHSKKNLSPRLGFAWDIRGDGKTALRGGAALLYDIGNIGTSMFIASSGTPPLAGRSIAENPAPPFGPYPVIPANNLGNNPRFIDFKLQQPHMASWNLSIDRQLPANMGLTIAYAGSRGWNLMTAGEGNPVLPVGTPAVVNGVPTCSNQLPGPAFSPTAPKCWIGDNRLTPGPIERDPRTSPYWGTIDYRTALGNSWYHSLQGSLTKRLSRGLQFNGAYTWSKTLDQGNGQNNDSGTQCQDMANLSYCKGPAPYDQRHTFRFSAIYRFPFQKTGLVGKLVNGWWISGIQTWTSGLPFTPTTTINRALSQGGTLLANGRVSAPTTGTSSRVDILPGIDPEEVTRGTSAGCSDRSGNVLVQPGTKLGTPQQFFDPCAFTIPPLGFLGNTSRGLFFGPNASNLSFSLVKDTALPLLGEQASLQFRAELFNVLNHPSYGSPAVATFTANENARNAFVGALAANAGVIPTSSNFSQSRELQLALKIIF